MVMKNQSWPTGDASHIELIDTEGEVKAWYTSALDAGKEGDERCKIM
jgi:hypothetical protein